MTTTTHYQGSLTQERIVSTLNTQLPILPYQYAHDSEDHDLYYPPAVVKALLAFVRSRPAFVQLDTRQPDYAAWGEKYLEIFDDVLGVVSGGAELGLSSTLFTTALPTVSGFVTDPGSFRKDLDNALALDTGTGMPSQFDQLSRLLFYVNFSRESFNVPVEDKPRMERERAYMRWLAWRRTAIEPVVAFYNLVLDACYTALEFLAELSPGAALRFRRLEAVPVAGLGRKNLGFWRSLESSIRKWSGEDVTELVTPLNPKLLNPRLLFDGYVVAASLLRRIELALYPHPLTAGADGFAVRPPEQPEVALSTGWEASVPFERLLFAGHMPWDSEIARGSLKSYDFRASNAGFSNLGQLPNLNDAPRVFFNPQRVYSYEDSLVVRNQVVGPNAFHTDYLPVTTGPGLLQESEADFKNRLNGLGYAADARFFFLDSNRGRHTVELLVPRGFVSRKIVDLEGSPIGDFSREMSITRTRSALEGLTSIKVPVFRRSGGRALAE